MIQKSAVDACRSIAALYSYDVVPPPVGGDKRVTIGTMNEKERRHEEELQARIAEYEACEGYRIRDELHAFRTGYDIFVENYGDLKRALTRARDPQQWPHLWDERHKYRLVRFNKEISRLLHNFVAAAKSLVEHTRNFMRSNYASTDFFEEYQARVNRDFACDPLIQFVQDLRNYMLHKSLTAASLILKTGDGRLAEKSYVALAPNKLREWDQWTVEARPILTVWTAKEASKKSWTPTGTR